MTSEMAFLLWEEDKIATKVYAKICSNFSMTFPKIN